MSESILKEKSKAFAKDIVLLCRRLKQNNVEGALINQLLRCGTSVGANIHEAKYAQSTKDFISKFEIALKYTFTGWYKDYACFEPWNDTADTVQSDMTLYAGWQKLQ